MHRNILIPNKNATDDIYTMEASPEELDTMVELAGYINENIISKKSEYTNSSGVKHSPRYTILKPHKNVFFLIGDGEVKDTKKPYARNGFFGSGSFGRVKAGVMFEREENENYVLNNTDFAIKIMHRYEAYSKEGAEAKYQKLLTEGEFCRRVYDIGEVVKSKDGKKLYLIMPKLTGKKIFHLDFDHMSFEQLMTLIKAVTDELQRLHQLNIKHGDTQFGNILYDEDKEEAHFFDFGSSANIDSNNVNTNSDWATLIYCFYSTVEYVIKEDNKIIDPRLSHELAKLLKQYHEKANQDNFNYDELKIRLNSLAEQHKETRHFRQSMVK